MADAPLVALLAAGRGSRFGGGKLDAELAGQPVGSHVIAALEAAGLGPGIIVTGPDAPAFCAHHHEWALVRNSHPDRGLATSLGVAAREAESRVASRLLVALADMPLVPAAHFARLAAIEGPAATLHGDRPGVPALLPSQFYDGLADLSGDRGAGPMLAELPGVELLHATSECLLDIDRPEDLERAEVILSGKAG